MEENFRKIFSYGFTTKTLGHGVGLHASAISMQEMGGEIQVARGEETGGALFTLVFPLIERGQIKD